MTEQSLCLHPKSIRKARLQAICMVIDGFSASDIMRYIKLWAFWWLRCLGQNWKVQDLVDLLFSSLRRGNLSNRSASYAQAQQALLLLKQRYDLGPHSFQDFA